jgi:hypothetical protein
MKLPTPPIDRSSPGQLMLDTGLSELDLAYIAGFFDGEGCVQIRKRGRRWEGMIRIVNTSFPIMAWLARATGSKLSRRPVAAGNPKGRCSFELCLQHKKAFRWAVLLRPYSRIKRDELDLLINFRGTISHGATTVSPATETLRHEIAATCKALKKRRWPRDCRCD